MKTLTLLMLLGLHGLTAGCAFGQEQGVAAASQAEVNAGTIGGKYVSPKTLSGSGIGANTNALTLAQQNRLALALTNLPPVVGAATNALIAQEVYGRDLGHAIGFLNDTTNGPADSTLIYSVDQFIDGGGNNVGTFVFGAQVYAPRWLGDGTGLTGVAPLNNPQFTGDVSINSGGALYGPSWEVSTAGVGTFPAILCSQVIGTTLTTQSGILTNGALVWYAVQTNGNPSAVSAPNGSICTTTNGQFYVRSNATWILK